MHCRQSYKLFWIICYRGLSKLLLPSIYWNTESTKYWPWLKSINHVFSWLSAVPIMGWAITNLFFSVPNYTSMKIKSHTHTPSIRRVMDLFKQNLSFTRKNYCSEPWSDCRLLNSQDRFNHSWDSWPITLRLGSKAVIYPRKNSGQIEVSISLSLNSNFFAMLMFPEMLF